MFDQFLEYMRLGGSIMWIILALSVFSGAIIIERIVFFILASGNLEKIEADFIKIISKGEKSGFISGRTSLHRLFATALEHWTLNDERLSFKLEEEIQQELHIWEKNISLLEVVARVAPLLGLLGTVLGMVEMFGSLSAGGAIDARVVTGGIWKALFTTVAGLSVAIPILLAHSVLVGVINTEEKSMERGANFIIDKHMDEQTGGGS